MSSIRVEDLLADGVQMGPLVNAKRLAAIEGFVADATAKGARVAAGGGRLGERGCFHVLTLLDEVPDSARIMSDEPFGAVAAMQPFRSLDEVVAKANALPYGLAAYAPRSARTLREMTDRLEVGLLGLNG